MHQGGNLVDGLTNTASDAFGTVKGGLEGTVHQAKNGITHTVKKAEDAAGWVLNESGKSWCVKLITPDTDLLQRLRGHIRSKLQIKLGHLLLILPRTLATHSIQ